MKKLYRLLGLLALAVGLVGIFVPLLPTVPFMLLAACVFARGNPAWEARLLAHPRFGPPILAWRARGAIGPRAKLAALAALSGSAVLGLVALPDHWRYVPAGVAAACGLWIGTRPSR